MEKKIKIAIGVIFIAVIVIAVLLLPKENPTQTDKIARCLSEKGAVMYGTNECYFCKEQKKLFEESFQYINFVDCDVNRTICTNNGVEAFPTWIINNQTYVGVQKLSQLMNYAGCSL